MNQQLYSGIIWKLQAHLSVPRIFRWTLGELQFFVIVTSENNHIYIYLVILAISSLNYIITLNITLNIITLYLVILAISSLNYIITLIETFTLFYSYLSSIQVYHNLTSSTIIRKYFHLPD